MGNFLKKTLVLKEPSFKGSPPPFSWVGRQWGAGGSYLRLLDLKSRTDLKGTYLQAE